MSGSFTRKMDKNKNFVEIKHLQEQDATLDQTTMSLAEPKPTTSTPTHSFILPPSSDMSSINSTLSHKHSNPKQVAKKLAPPATVISKRRFAPTDFKTVRSERIKATFPAKLTSLSSGGSRPSSPEVSSKEVTSKTVRNRYIEFLQAQVLKHRLEQAHAARTQETMSKVCKLSQLNEGLADRELELDNRYQTLRFIRDMRSKLGSELLILDDIIASMSELDMSQLSEALDSSRHQLPTKNVIPPTDFSSIMEETLVLLDKMPELSNLKEGALQLSSMTKCKDQILKARNCIATKLKHLENTTVLKASRETQELLKSSTDEIEELSLSATSLEL